MNTTNDHLAGDKPKTGAQTPQAKRTVMEYHGNNKQAAIAGASWYRMKYGRHYKCEQAQGACGIEWAVVEVTFPKPGAA